MLSTLFVKRREADYARTEFVV